MNGTPYIDIDYCKYSMPYRKGTSIWSNIEWIARPLCKRDCGKMNVANGRPGQHIRTAQQGRDKGTITDKPFKQCELYVIPNELIMDIFKGVV
jgi:hypothetical protein